MEVYKMKKVLIVYHSQTGNTGKIARAISDELDSDCSIDMKSIEESADINLNEYDALFIGSPILAATIAEPVKEFIGTLQNSASYTVAGFITRSSNKKQGYMNGIDLIRNTCRNNNISYSGCFSCVGAMNPEIYDFIKEKKGFSDAEWDEKVQLMKGHPNNNDLIDAKKFARDVIDAVKC